MQTGIEAFSIANIEFIDLMKVITIPVDITFLMIYYN
jgi:hypothetical protein